MSTTLTFRFEEALVYAARLHARQRRKGSDIPYVSHLQVVCSRVLGTAEEKTKPWPL